MLFDCNYDMKTLGRKMRDGNFYFICVRYWKAFRESNPISREDVLEQIIWNNRFILREGFSLYFHSFHHKGIVKIRDIVCGSRFLSFSLARKKYGIVNFLDYYSVIDSIPLHWKKLIRMR